MKILLIKTGAAGDVLRTTFLLDFFRNDEIHWYCTEKNSCLAGGKVITKPEEADDHYDWVINLEENPTDFDFINELSAHQHTGPYTSPGGVVYQPCPNVWFDMSRVSRFGKETADRLKWFNRKSYQELIAEMLGKTFAGQFYKPVVYNPLHSLCKGDVGVVISDDSVWPTKNCANVGPAADWLKDAGYVVNMLKRRDTISEHVADICAHKVIICADSLPMHICIAHKIPCVALFTCTSPWEIETYGIVNKVVSPMLQDHFYKTGYNEAVASSISKEEIIKAVQERMNYGR